MTFSSDPALNTNQLPVSLDINSDEEGYDNILQLYLRRIANAVNSKESGLFLLQENAPFEQWFNEVTEVSSTQQYLRNAYRLTVDLVLLNGAPIATQAPNTPLSLVLTTSTIPIAIVGYMFPVQGFGGALDSAGISYFINDPDVYVRYVSATNTFLVYNTTGNNLTWCVYVIEYLKN
jgi:hypothetical protein